MFLIIFVSHSVTIFTGFGEFLMVPNGPDHYRFDNKWSGLVWSNLAGKNNGLIWSGPSGGPLRIFRTGPALYGLVRLNGLQP